MAYNAWIGGNGGAAERAQVSTITFGGTWEATDLADIILAAEDSALTQTISTAAGSTDIPTLMATIVVALNNAADRTHSTFKGLFEGITFAVASSTTITATSQVAGKPFYISVSTTETGGGTADDQTISVTTTTPNLGRLDFNTAANHMTGAVPTTGDHYHWDARAMNGVRYGLSQAGITLASETQWEGFRFYVGWWTHIAGLAVNHFALKMSATICNLGEKATGGSNVNPGMFIRNFGTAQVTVNVKGTAHTGTVGGGLPPVMLVGTHASNKCAVTGFSNVGWGVATPGADFKLAELVNASVGGTVICGAGATQLTNVRQRGTGHTIVNTAITGDGTSDNYGLAVTAGMFTANGTGTITLAKFTGGYSYLNNARGGAIVTGYYQSGTATVDFTQDARTGTITTVHHFDASQGAKAKAVSQTQITAAGLGFDLAGDAGGGSPD